MSADDRVRDEDDFVNLRRFDFSLAKVCERYPEGCPERVIAAALCVEEEDLAALYQEAVDMLRDLMGVDRDA